MRLIIAGGGTGGHLFPGIAVAEEFLGRDPDNRVLFVGTERGIESRVLPGLGYRLEKIAAAGVRGKSGMARLKGLALFLYAYGESRKIFRDFRPDVVMGVGGYASGPVVLAARGMEIPRFVHEQNAIPGFTNRFLSRFVEKVFVSLEESSPFFPKGKTLLTGNPLRRSILDQVLAPPRERGAGMHLLVFGGSQGATAINRAMVAALPLLRDISGLAITHQTGERDLEEVRRGYAEAGVEADVRPFISDMAAAYRAADVVVCRAGATTIAEVTACGKPCIFIPFPHAVDDHQRRNAEALLKKDAGQMLLERELSGESLAAAVSGLVADPARLEEIGRNASLLARLDAAQVIVDEMLKSVNRA